MLSTVEIIAAGTTNQEIIELQIGGQTVASYSQLGTGANDNQFQTRSFTTAARVTADDVRIQFSNDLLDPVSGIDRNVRIDAIVIDGVRFETEDSSVFSTGTFLNADGIEPGFGRGDILHSNGFFQYAGGGGISTPITVNARGFEGTESFALQIDGQTVQTFENISTTFSSYNFEATGNVTADQIRVVFLNDQFDLENGIDSNLVVDDIVVGGVQFETEASNVFSTGTFRTEDGIVDGFGRGDTLHGNGFFQFSSDVVPQDVVNSTSITVNARGNEGSESFALQIDGQTVQTFENIGTEFVSFNFQANESVTADQIRVVFLNDLFDADNGIFLDLTVDNIVVDGVQFETEAPNVFSNGTFRLEDGVVDGFGRGDTLHANGFFQFSSDVVNQPTTPVVQPPPVVEPPVVEPPVVEPPVVEPPVVVQPPVVEPPALSSGDGLLAEYFLGRDFDTFVRDGVESTVDFNFNRGGPDGLPDDNFSIRFTGQVEALYSEVYTFETTSDDGVRLFVDGELIIDNFTNHAATVDRGTIRLEAGQRYDIRLEYYERTGRSIIQLRWSSNSQDLETISQSQLYSGTGDVGPVNQTPVNQPPVVAPPVAGPQGVRVPVTYFVSSSGSDNFNEEQSQNRGTPFQTIQRAVDAARAGDTVIVLDGTYREEIFLRHSGNADEEIVIRAENQEGARLLGFIHGRDVSYVTIDGFDVTNSNDDVITQGIVFFESHHITVSNNLVRDSFGGGIAFNQSDSILIEGNTTSGNAFFSPDAHSGISVYQPQRREDATGEYGVIIRNNISFNNINLVGNQNCCGGRPTDGNGIVLDDYQNSQESGNGIDYDRRTLVENNITFDNGGNGIHVFRSHDIDIRNNTSVGNVMNLNNGAQINVSASRDVNVYNNIVSADSGQNAVRSSNSSRVTLEFNIIDGPEVGFSNDSTNFFNTEPDFVPGTFELRAGAIGIDQGRDIDNPVGSDDVLGQDRVVGRIDIGAIERQS